ncbi:MAG: DUF4129 domain-containing protein [Chitinophagaceae bacterium]
MRRKYNVIKRNYLPASFCRMTLMLVLLCYGIVLHAQQEQTVTDTAYEVEEDYPDIAEEEVVLDTAGYDASNISISDQPRSDRALLFLAKENQSVESYHLRRINALQKEKLKADKDYWYADYNFKKKEVVQEKRKKSFVWSDGMQVLLWILIIGGFTAVLIIYLGNNNIGLLRSSKKIKDAAAEESETDDIFGINYDKEIAAATAAGNFRLATRLLFLRLLRLMADKQIINYKSDSTNMDYLMQLANGPYYKPFFQLARVYEYIWYGEFIIDGARYNSIREEFSDLTKTIGHH